MIQIIEAPKCSIDDITQIATKIKNYCHNNWKLDEEVPSAASKLLVAAIKWLHGVGSFVHMKPTEQTNLLRSNWKELYILTAVEYSFFFDEGKFRPQSKPSA